MVRAAYSPATIDEVVDYALAAAPYMALSRYPQAATRPARPIDRLFASGFGRNAVELIRNEQQTLWLVGALAAEVIHEADQIASQSSGTGPLNIRDEAIRTLVVPARPDRPSVLLTLDPAVSREDAPQALPITLLDPELIERVAAAVGHYASPSNDFAMMSRNVAADEVVRRALQGGPSVLTEILWIAQPRQVVARRPRMVPLSAPWPHLRVAFNGQRSTVGIFCYDADGEFGVTACYHGTGPAGTAVTVDGIDSAVKRASEVQDLVFIPLPQTPLPSLRGRGGVLAGRTPGQYGRAEFHGAASGAAQTWISSFDAGLLRLRPAIQFRVQTPPDTNSGDSGAALLNQDDEIVGFAFERTGLGEVPEMSDWIWAANALAALGLRPA